MSYHNIYVFFASFYGIVFTVACFGVGLYVYNWWDQIHILYPAYGGLYLKLSNITQFTWISCVLGLSFLVITVIASTSLICGQKFSTFATVLFGIIYIGVCTLTALLILASTKQSCDKMNNSPKNEVQQDIYHNYIQWLQDFTRGWTKSELTEYEKNYEYIVCEQSGRSSWIWYCFLIATPILAIISLIYRYLEKRTEYDEIMDRTPISHDEKHGYRYIEKRTENGPKVSKK